MRTRHGGPCSPAGPPFLKLLVEVVDLGATPEGLPVLPAVKSLPDLMGRKKVGPAEIDTGLLVGSWRRLVLSAPHLEPGTVDWKAYTFCVLEQFHRMLRCKQVFAKSSSKWGDPRAKLLAGEAWEQARPTVLASLGLPGQAGEHLAAGAAAQEPGQEPDGACRVGDGLDGAGQVDGDDVVGDEFGSEALGQGAHGVHGMPSAKPGAPHLEDLRLEAGTCGVEGGGTARGAGAGSGDSRTSLATWLPPRRSRRSVFRCGS